MQIFSLSAINDPTPASKKWVHDLHIKIDHCAVRFEGKGNRYISLILAAKGELFLMVAQ